jgi:hypothetical protein
VSGYPRGMSASTVAARWSVATRLTAGALAWSIGLVVAAVALPVYSGSSTSSDVNGVTLTNSTLVQVNGIRALVLMAVPALVSIIVLVAIRARRSGARWASPVAWTAIAVLIAEAMVGFMTIGLFIVPTIVLLVMAMARSRTPPPPT